VPSPCCAKCSRCDAALCPLRRATAGSGLRSENAAEQSFGADGPFLLGRQYSVCDVYLYMLAWWAKKLQAIPDVLMFRAGLSWRLPLD